MDLSAELEPMAVGLESMTVGSKLATSKSCAFDLREFGNAEVWRSAVVEFMATGIMVFLSISAILTCLQGSESSPTFLIAFIHIAIVSSCIMAAGPASGGHLNPCITLTCMITGFTSPVRGIIYMFAQSTGACVGSAFVDGIVSSTIASKFSLGGCLLRASVSDTQSDMEVFPGLLSEFCFTFVLLFVAFMIVLDPKRFKEAGPILSPILVGIIVGMLLFISTGFSGLSSYSGAGMNPARCFGPAVVAGKDLWHGHWIYWVGPFSASLLVGTIYCIIPPNHAEIYTTKLDIITQLKDTLSKAS